VGVEAVKVLIEVGVLLLLLLPAHAHALALLLLLLPPTHARQAFLLLLLPSELAHALALSLLLPVHAPAHVHVLDRALNVQLLLPHAHAHAHAHTITNGLPHGQTRALSVDHAITRCRPCSRCRTRFSSRCSSKESLVHC